MNAVASIVGRIAVIESRFGPPPTVRPSAARPDAAGFDPFGDHYRQAVEAAQASNPAPATAQPPVVSAIGSVRLTSPTGPPGSAPANGAPTFDEMMAAVSGVAGPPGPRRVGGYGTMPVPDGLVDFGNGRIPADELYGIGQGTHRLAAPAAASWRNLVAAAASDGIQIRITDSYRSFDEQVDLAERKGLYVNGGLAATPGTSNHGWGLAVDADVGDPATQEWLQVNGPRFGWVEAVPREPWHWEFRPNQV